MPQSKQAVCECADVVWTGFTADIVNMCQPSSCLPSLQLRQTQPSVLKEQTTLPVLCDAKLKIMSRFRDISCVYLVRASLLAI